MKMDEPRAMSSFVVFAIVIIAGLAFWGSCARAEEVTAALSEEDKIVVPQKTCDKVGHFVLTVDTKQKRVSITYRKGTVIDGTFVPVVSESFIFENEDDGIQWWDIFKSKIKINNEKATAESLWKLFEAAIQAKKK